MQIHKYQQKYSKVFRKMKTLSEYIIANYLNDGHLLEHIKEPVLKLLFYRATTSFRSIILLLESYQIIDAYSIFRVLLEATVNYKYINNNEERIKAYKIYSIKRNYNAYQNILDQTKFFKELPDVSQFLFDDNDIKEGRNAAQIMKKKKNEIEEYANAWEKITFDCKIEDVGIDNPAIKSIWNSASDSVHSGWITLTKIMNDDLIVTMEPLAKIVFL